MEVNNNLGTMINPLNHTNAQMSSSNYVSFCNSSLVLPVPHVIILCSPTKVGVRKAVGFLELFFVNGNYSPNGL